MTTIAWPTDAEWKKRRRERISTALLAGIMSSGTVEQGTSHRMLVAEAVDLADALIAELDKEQAS